MPPDNAVKNVGPTSPPQAQPTVHPTVEDPDLTGTPLALEQLPETRAQLRASVKGLRTQVRGEVFALKLGVCAGLTAGGVLLALRPDLWLRVIGTVLLGCMFAHATELQHQALHNIGFRRQRANTVAGVILGMPMLISFAAYRATHLRHHRYLGTPQNREFFDYGDQYGTAIERTRMSVALSWLVRFSMVEHYRRFLIDSGRALRWQDFPGENATTSRRIRRDLLLILGAILLLVAASIAAGEALVVWVWLLPLLVVAAPVHAVVELPEHFRCETLSLDPFSNTRSIRSNRFMAWFTNGNNFHVEHHLMPNLPIERLPDLHAVVRPRLRYFNSGYVDYFSRLLWRRAPAGPGPATAVTAVTAVTAATTATTTATTAPDPDTGAGAGAGAGTGTGTGQETPAAHA